jgi:hypothetical protein
VAKPSDFEFPDVGASVTKKKQLGVQAVGPAAPPKVKLDPASGPDWEHGYRPGTRGLPLIALGKGLKPQAGGGGNPANLKAALKIRFPKLR